MLLQMLLPNSQIVSRGREIARAVHCRNAEPFEGHPPLSLEVWRVAIKSQPDGSRRIGQARMYAIELRTVDPGEMPGRTATYNFETLFSGAQIVDALEGFPGFSAAATSPLARSLDELHQREAVHEVRDG